MAKAKAKSVYNQYGKQAASRASSHPSNIHSTIHMQTCRQTLTKTQANKQALNLNFNFNQPGPSLNPKPGIRHCIKQRHVACMRHALCQAVPVSNNDLQSVTVTHHMPTCFIMVMIIIMDRHVLDPWIPWIEHPNDHPNSRPTEAAQCLLFATPTPQVLQATLRWRGQNSALHCSASLSKACNALGWRWQSLAATGRRLRWASGHSRNSRGLSSGPSLGWLCLCVLVTLVVLRISTSFGSCNWARAPPLS